MNRLNDTAGLVPRTRKARKKTGNPRAPRRDFSFLIYIGLSPRGSPARGAGLHGAELRQERGQLMEPYLHYGKVSAKRLNANAAQHAVVAGLCCIVLLGGAA